MHPDEDLLSAMSAPREFNPPALMLARLAYVLHLGLALASVVLSVGSVAGRRADLAIVALAALALAACLRRVLHRRNLIEDCENSLNRSFDADVADPQAWPDAADPHLARLLSQRAWIEEQRGSSAFDPWALLAVQHDIEEHLRKTRRAGGEQSGSSRSEHPQEPN